MNSLHMTGVLQVQPHPIEFQWLRFEINPLFYFQLTTYLLAKESSRCKRIEDLKFSESVKKKSADYVKKYMAKFGGAYKRSPSQ